MNGDLTWKKVLPFFKIMWPILVAIAIVGINWGAIDARMDSMEEDIREIKLAVADSQSITTGVQTDIAAMRSDIEWITTWLKERENE